MKKALRIVGALLLLAVIGGCIYLDTLMPIIPSRELVVVILGYSPKPDHHTAHPPIRKLGKTDKTHQFCLGKTDKV